MAFKAEEFQALIEREGVMDFIWPRTWTDIPGTEIGLYEMGNERWGCTFEISPSVYAGSDAANTLKTVFEGASLPNGSSIQFFSFASRNLQSKIEAYKVLHSSIGEVEYKDALLDMRDARVDWLKKHSNENIFGKGNDLRIRNFVNLVCITIPRYKSAGVEFTEAELVANFSKVQQSLSSFFPRKYTSKQWVTIMREILIPDDPKWFPPHDKFNALNYQVVDNDSILLIDDKYNCLGIGKKISKEEDIKNKEAENMNYTDVENNNSGIFSIFKNIFKKNKEEELEAYTKWKAKTFSTKLFPETVSLAETIGKFYDHFGTKMSPNIPCPFMVSMIVYFEDSEGLKKEVEEKVNWNLWQTESLGSAVRFFPEIKERAIEADRLKQLLHNGSTPMYASWSLTIMDSSITNVNKYSEAIKNEFLKSNWILQEETEIPHIMFLYHLPLNFEPYILKDLAKRMNTFFSANAASITPLITGDKGFGDPVLTYTDRGAQLSSIDIFSSSTNYNFCVIGSSGSGKSYLMSDFFNNYLLNGAKIRIIDVGRSYKSYCQSVGGQYIEFTEEADVCLNFFTNIQLNEHGHIHEDEMQTIVPLIGLMAMISVEDLNENDIKTPVIKSLISQAVTRAFKSRQRNAGMQDVVEAMEQMAIETKDETGDNDQILFNLIRALYSFSDPDGEYYSFFNGDNNLKFNSDFVVLELEELDTKAHLKSVVLASISHIIGTEFFLGDRSQKKILAIDEAWSIMDNKIVMAFLETSARRLRKYYGASGIITQTFADFFKNSATRAIFDTSAWKIYLQQSEESIRAASQRGELNMDESILSLLSTIKTKPPYYSELMIKQDSGAFFVGRLITDKVAHWIYTNKPSDEAILNEIRTKYGITMLDARFIKGTAVTNDISIEEAYIKRLSDGKMIKSGGK